MQKNLSLIEFSVQNWGPFKEKVTFSMSARKNDGHTFVSNGENLLKTALVYGPNASGKSSLLDAFDGMRRTLLFSANAVEVNNVESKLPHCPFLALKGFDTKPSFFEVIFSLDEKGFAGVYKYSFLVSSTEVTEETLVEISESGNESVMIERKGKKISTNETFKEIADFLVKQGDIRNDALFLSLSAQLNNKFSSEILRAFGKVNVITGIHNLQYERFTYNQFKNNPDFKDKVLKYLQQADFCINGGAVKNETIADSVSKKRRFLDIFFLHPLFSKNSEEVGSFEMPFKKESDGTKSFFHILGPIIDTLENGKILFIDELDNSLHPLLTKFIVDLFESSEVNKNNAQLIVTTHDVSLLASKKLIKDQFWFTEKDKCGASTLFSLAEFTASELRNDSGYSKKYLEGRFGALPIIGMVTD